jgi:hypothetical protein
MRKLRELSKLPTDPDYWGELEARILSGRAAGRQGGNGWWAPVATRAGALVGLAAAAGIAALFLIPPRGSTRNSNPTVLFRLPDDPAMHVFLSSSRPPSLASLMASLPWSEP